MSVLEFYWWLLPLPLIYVVVVFLLLAEPNRKRVPPLRSPALVWRALVAAMAGAAAGAGIGLLVFAGPSWVTGDDGLAWLTMFPALAIAPVAAFYLAYRCGRWLVLGGANGRV